MAGPAHAPAPSPPRPRQVDRLEASVEPTWEGLVQPLERIVDRLSRAWGTVSHLKAVKDTEELRKVGTPAGAPEGALRARAGRGGSRSAAAGGVRGALARGFGRRGASRWADALNTRPCCTPLLCPELPQAVEEVQPERVKLSLRLSQVRRGWHPICSCCACCRGCLQP